MPLWAESRIHGDVYVRFGGRLSETYHRKVAWRRQPSLHMADELKRQSVDRITLKHHMPEQEAGTEGKSNLAV